MVARAALFVDTAYLLALVNTRDRWHVSAVRWQQALATQRRSLVTTDFVLLEFGDALARPLFRQRALQVIDRLRSGKHALVVPASNTVLLRAIELYRSRSDKEWGLTDCTSFVVMQEHGLSDALTSDDHFRQAGFRPLLELEPS